MCEDILYHIMTRLQSQSITPSPSEYHLNVLKFSKFWNIILCATGSVEKLHSNPFVKRVKTSIDELGGLLLEKSIDIKSLQQLLKHSDEELFYFFDAAVAKKDVIVTRDEIARIRELCDDYQHQYDLLFKFYGRFCSAAQITDGNVYLRRLESSDKVKLKQVLETDYWAYHEKTLDSARRCYKFNQSQTFRNIFEYFLQKDSSATKVEYIAQKLIPTVFEKYNVICKKLKEWENLEC